jgi:hypothetical protein
MSRLAVVTAIPGVEPCHYCGLPADTIDHVVPQAMILDARDSGDEALLAAVTERRRRMVVPACRECNGLGRSVMDPTLAARTLRIKSRLRMRHRKALAMPDWSDTELMDLSERLRNLVIGAIYERDELRKRIAW